MKIVNKKEIIESINNNEIVVAPTDTVYGLMIKMSKKNEEKLNTFKKRDKEQKISAIFASVDDLLQKTDNLDEERINMIKNKLPGKYTFIVDLKKDYVNSLGFDRIDFGVRVTSNKYIQDIIKETGPLLATSCNYTKEDICVDIKDIKKIFKEININVYYKGKGTDTASSIIKINDKKISILR